MSVRSAHMGLTHGTHAWHRPCPFRVFAQITALKSLGLNIRKAQVGPSKAGVSKEFYVTEAVTSEKIVKSARLEEIRQTVLASLQETFPVRRPQLPGAQA